MRVFTAVRHSNDPRFFYGGLWSSNFYPALRALGHTIVESATDLCPTSRFMDIAENFTAAERAERTRTTERILDEVRAARAGGGVDLFLGYFYNSHFDPAGFDELRRLGIPSINYFCNSIYQFELVAAVAAKADISWHAERDARASYLAVGAKPVWVQMGADPDVYRPISVDRREPAACFVGQNYADRDRWMSALIRAGVPVAIYGPGWGNDSVRTPANQSVQEEYLGRKASRPGSARAYAKALGDMVRRDGLLPAASRLTRIVRSRREHKQNSHLFAPFAQGPVPFQEIAPVFSRYEVCLNFSNVWADGQPGAALIPHVRLRDFEAPMARTCYLTGHTEEICEFYEVGREIDTYQSREEFVEKARFYLAHPDAAERLRQAGYERARRDHTWRRRFEQLFSAAGLQ